jgi:RHS repeat-associated protein
MEKDDEVKGYGNSLDFGARIYDTRLGRWLSVDPKQAKYPSLSPYNFVANSPLILVDPDGEKIIVGKQDQSRFMEDMGKVFGKGADKMFSFNDKNELVINSVVLTDKDKQTVLQGLQIVVNQDDITRIVYVDQPGKAYHPETREYAGNVLDRGGEMTGTIADRPSRNENTVYVYGEGNLDGGLVQVIVTDPVFDSEGKITDFGLKTKEATIEPRANNVIHGIGHVLYPTNDEQGKVIDFDNAGRRATNSTSGTNSVPERPYDAEHPAPSPK